ncbi:hypothetical protein AAEP93_010427 [Penicillium crustosum]
MFTLVMLDNDLGTREIPDVSPAYRTRTYHPTWISFSIHIVSTARSHLYPSPFNIMTELFAVLV